LTAIDWIVLALLVAFVASGLIRGFVRDLILILGIIGGIVMAIHFGPNVTDWFKPMPFFTGLGPILGYMLVFAAVVVVSVIIGYLVARFTHLKALGWFDRLVGGAFGVVKGFVLIWCLVAIALMASPASICRIKVSHLTLTIMETGCGLVKLYPPGLNPGSGIPDRRQQGDRRGILAEKYLDTIEAGFRIRPL